MFVVFEFRIKAEQQTPADLVVLACGFSSAQLRFGSVTHGLSHFVLLSGRPTFTLAKARI
jgi:hypothetical protein